MAFLFEANHKQNIFVKRRLKTDTRVAWVCFASYTWHCRASKICKKLVTEARSDWAPDPANPLPKFSPPRRVPHGVTLIGRLFDEGTIARAGIALERHFNVATETPPGF